MKRRTRSIGAFPDRDRVGTLLGPRDEFAGACFSPDGAWLFVNLQSVGVTFAITGPFAAGPLGAG